MRLPSLTPMRIALLLGTALSLLRFGGCTYIQFLDSRAIDYRSVQRGVEPPDPRVVVVAIDDRSLTEHGRWPWSRATMARLNDLLVAAGPSAIGFDIVESEPTRGRGESELPAHVDGLDDEAWHKVRSQLLVGDDPDRRLADSIRASRVSVVGYFLDFQASQPDAAPVTVSSYDLVRTSPGSRGERSIQHALSVTANIPAIQQAGAASGYFSTQSDPGDGIFRRVPMVVEYAGQMALPLPLAMLHVAQPGVQTSIRFADFGVESVRFGAQEIPVAEDGTLMLNYRGPGRTFPHISAAAVLAWEVDPARLKDKYVVVGVTATAVGDIRATPFDGVFPGTEIHATVLDNILRDDFLQLPKWVVLVEIGAMFAALLLLGLALRRARGWSGALAAVAMIGAYIEGSQWFYVKAGIPLGLAFPVLAIGLGYSMISLQQFLGEERDKRRIRAAFSSYLAPEMVRRIAEDPGKLKLGGEKKTLTILFSDIRDFTSISEHYDPVALTQLMNRFLSPMSNVILEERGTIDKYIGDAIMAFWNAPLDDADHAAHGCAAACKLHRVLGPLNEVLAAEAAAEGRGFLPLRAGVGLNTGACVVGNIGSDVRFDYSLLGDSVNLASRLEGLTKQYGVAMLISESVREQAPSFASLEVDLVRVKGKAEPVRIHALLGEAAVANSADFRRLAESHAAMLLAYRARDWDAAERLLALCRSLKVGGMTSDPDRGMDPLYDVYADRIAEFRLHPPADDWNGVFVATSK